MLPIIKRSTKADPAFNDLLVVYCRASIKECNNYIRLIAENHPSNSYVISSSYSASFGSVWVGSKNDMLNFLRNAAMFE